MYAIPLSSDQLLGEYFEAEPDRKCQETTRPEFQCRNNENPDPISEYLVPFVDDDVQIKNHSSRKSMIQRRMIKVDKAESDVPSPVQPSRRWMVPYQKKNTALKSEVPFHTRKCFISY